jgi:hypothetical protein
MRIREIFFFICLIISALCLAAGYGIAGQWIGAVVAIMVGLTWLLARKYPATWLPFICLVASVGLAVVGRLTGSSPLLMICGSGVALAAWDLIILNDALGSNSPGEQTRQYENRHLQSLVLVLGSALFVSLLGRFVNLHIPSIALMLLIVLSIWGLDRVWATIKKNDAGNSLR